ncbi:MAG: hypothetical protein ABI137_13350 [Antricoccus sp.]
MAGAATLHGLALPSGRTRPRRAGTGRIRLRLEMFGIAWVGYAEMTFIALLDAGLKFPQWLLDLSPTTHIGNPPAGAIQIPALVIMAAVVIISWRSAWWPSDVEGSRKADTRTGEPSSHRDGAREPPMIKVLR